MSTIDNGGQAFPCLERGGNGLDLTDGGMSMRDYFAAKALPIMWDAYDKGYCGLNDKDEPNVKTIASGAYQLADAMLRARKEGGAS